MIVDGYGYNDYIDVYRKKREKNNILIWNI